MYNSIRNISHSVLFGFTVVSLHTNVLPLARVSKDMYMYVCCQRQKIIVNTLKNNLSYWERKMALH